MQAAAITRDSQQRFLDRYYGVAHHVYDLTRKHYLFGRDRALEQLLERPWQTLVEIGPGTGRNLEMLHEARPAARLAGLEPSRPMLEHARERCPWARFRHGFAEDVRLRTFFHRAPDRVLLSYCLSMIPRPEATLGRLLSQLGPRGELWVVDFADGAGIPGVARKALHEWLRAFHVTPLPSAVLASAASVEYGPGRYYAIARFRRGR